MIPVPNWKEGIDLECERMSIYVWEILYSMKGGNEMARLMDTHKANILEQVREPPYRSFQS